MSRIIALKLLRLVPVLLLVSIGTFLLLELVPGDPVLAILGEDATPETYERVRTELNLDAPVWERYFSWLGNILTGDFGERLTRPGFNVIEGIQRHLPVTLEIAVLAMATALVVAVPMGVWAASHQGRRFDRISGGSAFAIIAVPSFLAALILIFYFANNDNQWIPRWLVFILLLSWAAWLVLVWLLQQFRQQLSASNTSEEARAFANLILAFVVAAFALGLFWVWPDFQTQGWTRWPSEGSLVDNLRDAFLPSFTVALTEIAVFMRLLRSDMITSLQEDYILSARAKGLTRRRILFRHALRPSSFSLITLAGVSLGRALGGTVIVETIFRVPGMGKFIIEEGVNRVDYSVVQGGVLVLATGYVLINAIVDIAYNYIDPRIRRGRR